MSTEKEKSSKLLHELLDVPQDHFCLEEDKADSKICNQSIDLGNVRVDAVRNHSLSNRHKTQTDLKDFTDNSSCFAPGVSTSSGSSSGASRSSSALHETRLVLLYVFVTVTIHKL